MSARARPNTRTAARGRIRKAAAADTAAAAAKKSKTKEHDSLSVLALCAVAAADAAAPAPPAAASPGPGVVPAAAAAAYARQRSVVKRTNTLPAVAISYNSNMNLVDKTNRLTALRSPYRKSSRWVVTVILHFLKLATVNAWILYKHVKGPRPYAAFFKILALRLLALRKLSKPRGLWAAPPVPVAAQVPQPRTKAGTPPRRRGRCVVCGGGKWNSKLNERGADVDRRSKTSSYCKPCSTGDARVWLCAQGDEGLDQACWRAHAAAAHKLNS